MQVAEPELVKRMNHEFQNAREYFKSVVAENKIRLYVTPQFHRQGIGQALLEFAKTLSPNHLWLY